MCSRTGRRKGWCSEMMKREQAEKAKLDLEFCIVMANSTEAPFVALKKEQADELYQLLREVVESKEPLQPELEGGGRSYYMVCGDCHGIVDQGDHFCKHCGREINWK